MTDAPRRRPVKRWKDGRQAYPWAEMRTGDWFFLPDHVGPLPRFRHEGPWADQKFKAIRTPVGVYVVRTR